MCPARAAAAVPRRSRSVQLADLSARLLSGRALFLRGMSVGDARVYTCTCTVHDKLSCTRLQNYTIGASLTDKSVSVLWNLSYTQQVGSRSQVKILGIKTVNTVYFLFRVSVTLAQRTWKAPYKCRIQHEGEVCYCTLSPVSTGMGHG